MECRTLDLTIISAEGLKSINKYDVYVVVHGTDGRELQITPVLKNAGSSDQLTWNFPMKFTIDEAEGIKDSLNLVIKIMAVNWLTRKTLGKRLSWWITVVRRNQHCHGAAKRLSWWITVVRRNQHCHGAWQWLSWWITVDMMALGLVNNFIFETSCQEMFLNDMLLLSSLDSDLLFKHKLYCISLRINFHLRGVAELESAVAEEASG
ncbi:C2 calcium-dependent membrane targeting [Artemisia annua]|uniref:C2 calcium-dependent membrane targeting n=1 Tax=Artemisia annua TaxID=35608 RepID=A0A2U1QL41_ARTAN|nr:C2 calcium-dependent membrane targeting [Artemisia annua]